MKHRLYTSKPSDELWALVHEKTGEQIDTIADALDIAFNKGWYIYIHARGEERVTFQGVLFNKRFTAMGEESKTWDGAVENALKRAFTEGNVVDRVAIGEVRNEINTLTR